MPRGFSGERRRVGVADVVLTLAATVAGVLLFWHPFDEAIAPLQYPYAAFPLLLLVGVRVGPRLVGVALLAVSAVASLVTVHDVGPFGRPGLDGLAQVQALHGFLAVMVVSTQLVAGVLAARRATERRARESADRLTSVLRAATELADNGPAALVRIEATHSGAVLMDCQLPGMDGYETARALRARETCERRTPILALTAGGLPEDRRRCLQAGMDDHLSKPIRGAELSAALSRAVRPAEPLIDPAHILHPHRDLPEIVDELVAIFADTTPALLSDLRHAVEHTDHAAMTRAAHMLAGASRGIGADVKATLAAGLERSGTPQVADVDRIELAFSQTTAAIRAVVGAPALPR